MSADLIIQAITGALVVGFLGIMWFRQQEMLEKIRTLFDLHNVKDPDGVPVWDVRHSLSDAIEKLADAATKQTEVMTEIRREVQVTNGRHRE